MDSIETAASLDPWTSSGPEAIGHQLVRISPPVMDAISRSDLESARQLSSLPLTPYLVTERCSKSFARRANQIKDNPTHDGWVARILLDPKGEVVGRAGFHGPPNQDGMLEVGYAMDPLHYRKGHARAGLRILLDVARDLPQVKTVRAVIRVDNLASSNLVQQFDFQKVGECWEEEDGQQTIFEVSVG